MPDTHSSELSVAFMTDASSNSAILFPNPDTRRRGNGHPIFSVRHSGVRHFKKTWRLAWQPRQCDPLKSMGAWISISHEQRSRTSANLVAHFGCASRALFETNAWKTLKVHEYYVALESLEEEGAC